MKANREVFDAFYKRHVRLVFATALAQGLDATLAEDATQEAFLRAWRHLPDIICREMPAQRAWLMTTVRHIASDLRRKMPLLMDAEREEKVGPGTREVGGGRMENATALRLDVVQALSQLSDEDRAIVVLRYFLERNSREIGEILDVPEGTVRRRLSACRQRLATSLSGWETNECQAGVGK